MSGHHRFCAYALRVLACLMYVTWSGNNLLVFGHDVDSMCSVRAPGAVVFVRIGRICFVEGCCKRRLNQGLHGFVRFSFWGFLALIFWVSCVCLVLWLAGKCCMWPVMCRVGRLTPLTQSLFLWIAVFCVIICEIAWTNAADLTSFCRVYIVIVAFHTSNLTSSKFCCTQNWTDVQIAVCIIMKISYVTCWQLMYVYVFTVVDFVNITKN